MLFARRVVIAGVNDFFALPNKFAKLPVKNLFHIAGSALIQVLLVDCNKCTRCCRRSRDRFLLWYTRSHRKVLAAVLHKITLGFGAEVTSGKTPPCMMRCASPHGTQRGKPEASASAKKFGTSLAILKTQGIFLLSLHPHPVLLSRPFSFRCNL